MPPAEKTLRAPALPARLAPVDPARFVAVSGERVALIGSEDGPFEFWMWPLKVLHGLGWLLRRADDVRPLVPRERELSVRPGEVELRWKGDAFDLRTEIFACPEKRGAALCFTLESDVPLELELSFRCDFRPMWPAGLGGQLAWVDRSTQAFALGEELGRFAVLIGAPGATTLFEASDRGLPEGEVKILLPFPAGGSSSVVALAGAELAREAGSPRPAAKTLAVAHELWWRLVSDWSSEREELRARSLRFLERTVTLATGDARLDQAFLWSKLAIERAWTSVEGIGRGLVAGLGPSGSGERPGRGWFFDGDALVAARALSLAGDAEGARAVLRFAAARARADGELAHETPLSARLCNWDEDHAEARSGETSGLELVSALDRHVQVAGDLELARDLWPTVERGLANRETRVDENGLLAREKTPDVPGRARTAADKIRSDVPLHSAWLAALQGAIRLAEALGKDATRFQEHFVRATTAFESFWSERRGRYVFAPVDPGAAAGAGEDFAACVAAPLARGIGNPRRAWATVQALGGPELARDWGVAGFATAAAEPAGSERGGVSASLTSAVALAQFAHASAFAGQQTLLTQAAMCDFGGLGLMEERLDGARAAGARHGLPHSIRAAGAFVEATLGGLFGLEVDAAKRRLVLRPSLPFAWSVARLENLAVGETRVDLEFTRAREPEETRLAVAIEHREGPSLQVAFAPILPPLSVSLDGPTFVHPSGAVVPRRSQRARSAGLVLEVRVLEGPALALPVVAPARGDTSRGVRLAAQEVRGDVVRWTLAGLAGTSAAIPFHSDRVVEVAGAAFADGALRVAFAAGAADEWKTSDVYVRAR